MKIKNKVLSGLILSTVIATGVFAYGGNQKGLDTQNQNCQMNMMKNGKKGFSHNKGDRSVMRMFKQLNLTNEQQTKIREIMIESRKNIKTANEAFTSSSFDKNKYIEIMAAKRDNMLKSKADVIEKSYALLTTKQKEQLKVLIELKQEKMQNMASNMPVKK
jgi:periplasmic protein CpxP/Spy